jgi:hypothetical protein
MVVLYSEHKLYQIFFALDYLGSEEMSKVARAFGNRVMKEAARDTEKGFTKNR